MPNAIIDRDHFATKFPSGALFGKKLTPSRKAGFDAIFDYWDSVGGGRSLAWPAYALATAWHETGGTMQPVREGFKTSDVEACDHVTAYCKKQGVKNYAARHPNGHSYYGRGYVQLTHGDNYKDSGSRLGVGNVLYDNPDQVMQPGTAAQILMLGMMDGRFRPAKGKLADYFDGTTEKWFEARELINGDKSKKPGWANGKRIGDLIADYGKGFFGALRYR
jgi:hypothetical protein